MAILSISFLESVFAGVVASAIYGGGLELIGLSKYNKPIELLLKGAFSKAVKKYFSKHPEIADQYEIKHSREYIKHLKDNVFNFGVGVKDGNIQHEILSLFEKEIHKNPLLRWWITYNQNKYTHEKLNQIVELANNHIFHIQKDIKDVKEGIQRIGAALGVKELVISNDILSDNPNIISSNIARRENVICELIDIMQKKPCVVITGTKRIGKTTLLYLLEANLKALGQLHKAIFVNNDYCKDVLISSLLSSYNLDNITHIIIDGISFSTSDTDNINWGFIKELTDKGINVIISSYDNIPRSFLTVNVDFAQEYNIPNLEQLDIESILPSYNAPNNLGKLIYSFTNGHPILVNALLLYLQKQDWCVTDNTWDDLFSNSYASGVDETLARIIQKLIADPMDRELFNRLLLVMGRLSDNELEIIAEIEPRIDSPRIRFNSFKNLFFESYSDNKYRATKLFRSAWKPDLVKSVRVEVNKQLGLYLIHNTQLNQLTICEAIMYLQNGGEIDLAGYIYIQYLISVAQNPQYIESKNEIALSFWADLPLPISMDIDIKLMIRYFQMLVNVNKKEKYDYLRNDYIELLSSYNKTDANKSFFYKVIGSITLLYDDVSNGLLYYRQAVQLGIPEIKGVTLENTYSLDPMNSIWFLLTRIRNIEDFKVWIDIYNNTDKHDFEDEDYDSCKIFSDLLSVEDVNNNECDKILNDLYIALDASEASSIDILSIILASKIIIVEGGDKKNIEKAISLYDKYIARYGNNNFAQFFLNKRIADVYYLEDKTKNKELVHKYYNIAIATENTKLKEQYISALLRLSSILKDDRLINKAYELFDQISDDQAYIKGDVLGEHSIFLWEQGQHKEAIYKLEEAIAILFDNKEDVPIEYKSLVVLWGGCINHYNKIIFNKELDDNQMIPYRGMFTLPKSACLEFYNEERIAASSYIQFDIFNQLGEIDAASRWVERLVIHNINTQSSYNPIYIKIIPYLMVNNQFNTAISLYNKSKISQEIYHKGFSCLVSDDDFFSYYVLPCIIKALTVYLTDKDKGRTLLYEICEYISNSYKDDDMSEMASTYIAIITDFINDIVFDRHRITLINNTGNYITQTLVYLLTSIYSDVKYAMELQLATIVSIDENLFKVFGNSSYLFLVDLFETYWIQRLSESPESFEGASHLKQKGVNLIRQKSGQARLKAIFRVFYNHIHDIKMNNKQEDWCDEL